MRKMPKLHRLDDPINYHRVAKAISQPEKQHFPAFIAAQGLHRRVVDEFERTSERLFKAKANRVRDYAVLRSDGCGARDPDSQSRSRRTSNRA